MSDLAKITGIVLTEEIKGDVWRGQQGAGKPEVVVKFYDESDRELAEHEVSLAEMAHARGVPTSKPLSSLPLPVSQNRVYSVWQFMKCDTVVDYYGEEATVWEGVSEGAKAEIHQLLDMLYDIGIFYHDRSPHNFVLVYDAGNKSKEETFAILDFEHAELHIDGFVPASLRKYEWNPDFA
jgi:hypothetical protein